VLGYVVLGPVGLLLLADSLRVAGLLPGGHEIKTVTQSRWYRISLQVRQLPLCVVVGAVACASVSPRAIQFPCRLRAC
jgi:hypothetical protein